MACEEHYFFSCKDPAGASILVVSRMVEPTETSFWKCCKSSEGGGKGTAGEKEEKLDLGKKAQRISRIQA